MNNSEPHIPLLAFVGTPNCGKSTIFNALTGLRQKVGNFPGVTVEPGVGIVNVEATQIQLIDLPGTYSLVPKSGDEEFTVQVLQGTTNKGKPDGVLFIIDGTNIETGLFLFSQFAELAIPCVVVVTMIDAIKAQGGVFDDIGLERALGVPVISVVGNKGIGMAEVRQQLARVQDFRVPSIPLQENATIEQRVDWARSTTTTVLNRFSRDPRSEKIDAILLHPIWGTLVFLLTMAIFFQSVFSWAEPLMSLIEGGVGWIQQGVLSVVPEGILQDFLTKGILAGVGAVVVFLPQIVLLSLFITLLEDCGYLARAAFLVDRVMGVFGLQGRSFIPLLGSFACAIPGIMSARIIPSDRDRMTTILVAPLMTCSARLPVYTLLISAFIPSVLLAGIFSLQAMVLAGLYLLGLVAGLCIAFILKRTMFTGDKLPFLIEFPPYRLPSFKSLWVTVWSRAKDFLYTAGTIILFISVLLWAMTEFPRTDIPPGTPPLVAEQLQLEHSAAGIVGKAIQPFFAPLGFDWKVTLGVIGSFAARETFVSVMGQIYATDVQEGSESLRGVLRSSLSLPVALSVIVFYVFALQCMSTIAIIRRETGSWKWAAFAFGYTFLLAYGLSAFTYFVASR